MRLNEKFGYIVLSRSEEDKDELIIEMIYVEPSMRRLGKGEILLKKAIDYARKKGYKQIGLYAHADDGMSTDSLVQWYRDAGFESDGDCNELMAMRL
jgi:ribosomal protein S18 acetylase RimI-like enzyme